MAAAPPTPHDALFRGVFGDPGHAFAHLRTLLPDAVARTLESGSLEPLAETFVDGRLAERQCNLFVADSIHYSHKVTEAISATSTTNQDFTSTTKQATPKPTKGSPGLAHPVPQPPSPAGGGGREGEG
ncbi:MAG: Rpn family recombination-promoting nuclease/putative transposase, partial [Myxococcota bacterium]|nr:Rpn family recombination-promoting nuclease/putative transposase [Myxococcota bacterium]